MSSSAISIVMPVRNGERFVREAVMSALDQGPIVTEVIVIDDGSTDGTRAKLDAIPDPRLRVEAAPVDGPGGVSAARNAGLALTRGEFVHFLDADDLLRPGALTALAASLDPDAVAAYGDYDRIDAGGRPIGRRRWLSRRQKPSGAIRDALLAGNFIVTGAIMVRREAFCALGGFATHLHYSEDWHAWCRLAATGSIRFVPGLQVMDYRVHGASTVAGRGLDLADLMPAIEAVYDDPELGGALDPARRATLRRRLETQKSAYCVSQALRTRRYAHGAGALWRALARNPRALPRLVLVSTAAMAGL